MYLADLFDDFERSLVRRDLSPCTVDAYHWALHDLIEKAMRPAKLTRIADLTREVLKEWQDSQIEREWEPRTRGLAGVAVRQFIRFGIDQPEGFTDAKLERALAKIKQPEPDPHPIPPADLAKIKAYLLPLPQWIWAQGGEATVEQLRDRALFPYILSTGGRVSEILQVRVDDYERPTIIQKGRTKKTLGVPPQAAALVRDYLAVRTDNRPELWLSFTTRTYLDLMTPGQVREIWHKLSALLGLTYWTTHAIRHTTATELFEAGVKDPVISKHMGHKTAAMLEVYRKVRPEQRQGAVDAMGEMLRPASAEAA